METLSKMIFRGDLPPVGHAISLHRTSVNGLSELIGGYQYWLDSGTSALALAIVDAKAAFPDIQRPRVIIPGYCCPDLISACVYAGVQPVAIDINENDPSYNLECLHKQLDEFAIAIIAVNFLGIRERLDELSAAIKRLGLRTRLIEDNAQWFPDCSVGCSEYADYTIFSFGRGKPLSLLGGGLLTSRTPLVSEALNQIDKCEAQPALLSIKITLYNLLLTPQFYLLLNRNPLLRLGETKYVPLEKISVMDDFRCALLSVNFKRYVERKSDVWLTYHKLVNSNGLQQLYALGSARKGRLLRYPLLCPTPDVKTHLLGQIQTRGLGVTAMYRVAISEIEGVAGLISVPSELVNAKFFAARFMTLPLHSGVTPHYQNEILSLLDP